MTETPQEIVDRELREHKRYTGDGLPGEPVNAPLPVGDPQSGVYNPKKVNLRNSMKATLEGAAQSASDAKDEADRAEEEADRSEGAADRAQNAASAVTSRAWFDYVSTLLADDNDVIGYVGSGADFEVGPGDIIAAQGFRYEVAASDAADAHIETAGVVKLYALPSEDGRVRFEQFGAGGADDTAPIDAAIDSGHPLFVTDGAEFTYAGTREITGLDIRGNGKIVGDGQDAFEIVSGDLRVWETQFENFGKVFHRDTTGDGKAIGKIDFFATTFADVFSAINLIGTGGFTDASFVGVNGNGFTKMVNLECHQYDSITVIGGNWDAEPGWDKDAATTHTGQRWGMWAGSSSADNDLGGHVNVQGLTVKNVVSLDARCDGVLVQSGKSFKAVGCTIDGILGYQSTFIDDGYIPYLTAPSSGLYSRIPNAIFEGNTLTDVAAAAIVSVETARDFMAIGNTLIATQAFCNRGFYLRHDYGIVANNTIRDYPAPITYIRPSSADQRPSGIAGNHIYGATIGYAIFVERTRRQTYVNDNHIYGVTNTFPEAIDDRLAGILWESNGSNTNATCFCNGNRVFDIVDTKSVSVIAAVLLWASAGTMTRFDIIGNYYSGAGTYPTVGLEGAHTIHKIDGNGNGTSSACVAVFGTAAKSFFNGYNVNASGDVTGRVTQSINLSGSTTSYTLGGFGLFGNRVLLTREAVNVVPLESMRAAKELWVGLSSLSNTGFTASFDVIPGGTVAVLGEVNYVNRRIDVAAA